MQKEKIRQRVIAITFFLLTSLFIPIHVMAEPDESIQMEIRGGFNGVVKLGAWAPIVVKVRSNRNISGEIQVEANLDQMRRIILAEPVELTGGGEQDITFEIPVVSAKKEINIRLVEKKKPIAEEKFKFNRLLPPDIKLVGVLSEDPEAFGWLNGNTIPVMQGYHVDERMKMMMASGQMVTSTAAVAVNPMEETDFHMQEAVVVPLDRNSFPDKIEVLEGFEFLVISKYDTSLLNEAQVDTLEKWVDTGGVLMLGTGLNWQKVYHGLPDSLKPFSIRGLKDYHSTNKLADFTGRDTPDMVLKLAEGDLGFEYIPLPIEAVNDFKPGTPMRYLNQDIIAGDSENPLVLKYTKEMGHILVFTFDPASEPFVSWQAKVKFTEYALRYINGTVQRFYERGNGFIQKQHYGGNNIQHLANEVPADKKPPFVWMFIGLGVYIVLAGPVLYLVLKKLDRRDWAWILIPTLSVVFLGGMYLFGFKSRYHTAVMNTVSIIEVRPDANEAAITSSIGIFNDKRGTLKLEYDRDNGMQTPLLQNNDMYYGHVPNETEGNVIAKLTLGDRPQFEQYDVMLWTPTVMNAQKTIPFDGNLLENVYLKDGRLQGSITNSTPFHLLDTVIVVGNNIIPVGDVLSGDTNQLDIPYNTAYKRPDEYLDGEFGRSHYNNWKDYPSDYQEKMRRRRIFENYIHDLYNIQRGKTRLALLARNDQEIDYGLIINDKEPQKYNQNLIKSETDSLYQPGQEVEIPGGIIWPDFYQSKEVGWQEGMNGIRVHSPGDMEFQFVLPDKLDVSEIQLSVENYIPLHIRYSMQNNQNNNTQIQVLTNQYEYYLYNVKTQDWEEFDAKTTISENIPDYIGIGREVRLRVRVVEMSQPDQEEEYQSGVYREYRQELLSMPEISVKGVAR